MCELGAHWNDFSQEHTLKLSEIQRRLDAIKAHSTALGDKDPDITFWIGFEDVHEVKPLRDLTLRLNGADDEPHMSRTVRPPYSYNLAIEPVKVD